MLFATEHRQVGLPCLFTSEPTKVCEKVRESKIIHIADAIAVQTTPSGPHAIKNKQNKDPPHLVVLA